MDNNIKLILREKLMREFNMSADIKSFKMCFNEPMKTSEEFKEIIKILINHGNDIGSYDNNHTCLILTSPIITTANDIDIMIGLYDDIPNMSYNDFKKKYKK